MRRVDGSVEIWTLAKRSVENNIIVILRRVMGLVETDASRRVIEILDGPDPAQALTRQIKGMRQETRRGKRECRNIWCEKQTQPRTCWTEGSEVCIAAARMLKCINLLKS